MIIVIRDTTRDSCVNGSRCVAFSGMMAMTMGFLLRRLPNKHLSSHLETLIGTPGHLIPT